MDRIFNPANNNEIEEESIGRLMWKYGASREEAIEFIHDIDWVIQEMGWNDGN